MLQCWKTSCPLLSFCAILALVFQHFLKFRLEEPTDFTEECRVGMLAVFPQECLYIPRIFHSMVSWDFTLFLFPADIVCPLYW